MMTIKCYLAPSKIEGLGVFTSEAIAKGVVAWRFNPCLDQVISLKTIETQPDHIRDFLERYTYPHHLECDSVILDADEGRFMNHSDHPNLDFSNPEFGRAVRAIAAEEELTCDYRIWTVGPLIHQPSRHKVAVISA